LRLEQRDGNLQAERALANRWRAWLTADHAAEEGPELVLERLVARKLRKISMLEHFARFVAVLEEAGTQTPTQLASLTDDGAATLSGALYEILMQLDEQRAAVGARELLEALAERAIPTAILTNGWSPLQHLKIARALAYAGPILVSDELGILKPEPAAFDKLIDVMNVPREYCWFVGDNPLTDVVGARRAGLRSVWFDWEHLPYPSGTPPPDARVARLRDLLDLLPGPDVRAENVGR